MLSAQNFHCWYCDTIEICCAIGPHKKVRWRRLSDVRLVREGARAPVLAMPMWTLLRKVSIFRWNKTLKTLSHKTSGIWNHCNKPPRHNLKRTANLKPYTWRMKKVWNLLSEKEQICDFSDAAVRCGGAAPLPFILTTNCPIFNFDCFLSCNLHLGPQYRSTRHKKSMLRKLLYVPWETYVKPGSFEMWTTRRKFFVCSETSVIWLRRKFSLVRGVLCGRVDVIMQLHKGASHIEQIRERNLRKIPLWWPSCRNPHEIIIRSVANIAA